MHLVHMLNHFKFGQLNSLLGLPVELVMYLWQCNVLML